MPVQLHTLSLTAFIALAAMPACAQNRPDTPPPCGPRAGVVDALNKSFDESPVGRGLTGDGKVFELLASPSGSWTVILTNPSGQSCFATAGESWEKLDEVQGIRAASGLSKARKIRFLETLGP